jgi:magnesium-transporting ATPase (P-type)
MITGDHPLNARTISKRHGILMMIPGNYYRRELDDLSWRNLKRFDHIKVSSAKGFSEQTAE